MYNSNVTQGAINENFRLRFEKFKTVATGKVNFLTPVTQIFSASQMATTTIGQLIDAVLSKQVQAYKNNRGTGEVKESWALEKARNFYPDGFGLIVLVALGNNEYAIAEGHNRIQALLYLRQEGIRKFDDVVLPVQVLTDQKQFMHVYGKLNSGRGHTVTNKLMNKDYALGKEVNDFLATLDNKEYRGVKIMTKDHVKQVAIQMISSTSANHGDMSFRQLQGKTGEVATLANYLPEEYTLHITNKARQGLKESMNFTLSVMREVIDRSDRTKRTAEEAQPTPIGRAIVGSAMFFSLLSWDRYTCSSLTDIDAGRIAKRLLDNAEATNRNLSLISSKKSMDEALIEFYDIIRTRKKVD